MSEQIEIRRLGLSNLFELLGWAKAEGWNPGLDDAVAFFAADKTGFLGCFVEDVLVAGISCVTYGDEFGFIGLYITRPDMRGKGYGLRVWNAAMEQLEGRVIGLDGVPEQQGNYTSMGFAKAYETARWSGMCKFNNDVEIYDIQELDRDQLGKVAAYDQGLFPAPRISFLEQWISAPHLTYAIMEQGKLAGYAVLRECHQGFKLGPLFADCDLKAKKLISAAINACAGTYLHIDAPNHQTTFKEFMIQKGFQSGFETARMYKGEVPKTDMKKMFAITSLELG